MRISDWSSDVCSSDLSCRSVFRGDRGRKPAASEPEGDVDQQDKYRHLDERTDDRGEGDRGRKAEGGDRNSDRELAIIARRGESDRGRARIIRSEEHTSELQSLMRLSSAVFCMKQQKEH